VAAVAIVKHSIREGRSPGALCRISGERGAVNRVGIVAVDAMRGNPYARARRLPVCGDAVTSAFGCIPY